MITPPTTRKTRWTGAVVASVVLLGGVSFSGTAAAETESERRQAEIRGRRSTIEQQIDVMRASDEEINAELDQIDASIAAQQAVVDAANAAAQEAAAAEVAAVEAHRAAERDVALLEAAIREMAVASYVHPPTADLLHSLQAASFSEALLQKAYLDARANRDVKLLDLLEIAETTAQRTAEERAEAADAAELALSRADAELGGLEQRRAEQAAFAADLQGRINGALAEAAALAELDASLAAKIQQEQAELIARLPEPPADDPAVDDPAVDDPPPPADDPDDVDPVDPSPPRRSTPRPPLRTAQGITVHEDIADALDAMLTAAAEDGVVLSGSGYRSTERQIELRRQNCGPTDYDIWDRPPSTCSPPTARPGTSMHERGKAIDMTFEGRLITSQDNPGYQWLAANAATFGLYNLPSEPWHWSTTGG